MVIERAMRIAQSLNGDNAQKQLAELWLDIDPDNLQAHRISAIQAVKRHDLQTAIHHMERIMDQGGDADFDSLAAMAGPICRRSNSRNCWPSTRRCRTATPTPRNWNTASPCC